MAAPVDATDEEIIERRLVYDGKGNDDRRILALLKTFLEWVDAPEHCFQEQLNKNRMLNTLTQVENAHAQAVQVVRMNRAEVDCYNSLYDQIETKISETQEKLKSFKVKLEDAKRIRRNKEEYDMLAKQILQHPGRHESQVELSKLNKEIAELQNDETRLTEQIDSCKKDFRLLMCQLYEMQSLLKERKYKENATEYKKSLKTAEPSSSSSAMDVT